MDSACHVIKLHVNPRLFSQMASYDWRVLTVSPYSTVVLASDNQHAVDACQAKPYRCVALAMDRAAEGMGRGRRSLLSDFSSFGGGEGEGDDSDGGGEGGGGGGRKLLAHILPRGTTYLTPGAMTNAEKRAHLAASAKSDMPTTTALATLVGRCKLKPVLRRVEPTCSRSRS